MQYLNDKATQKTYRYQIYPAVTVEDRRQVKRSDVSLIRILDNRTFVIVQCKLDVGLTFTVTNVDPLSQLFLEASYIRQKETAHYKEILCILTNWTVWHCFHVDLAQTPFKIKNYMKVVADPDASSTGAAIQQIINIVSLYWFPTLNSFCLYNVSLYRFPTLNSLFVLYSKL